MSDLETVECGICNYKYNPKRNSAACPHPVVVSLGTKLPEVDQDPNYNEHGQQTSGAYRADLLPMLALLKISILLQEGAKRHKDEDPSNPKWIQTPVREHVNRAMVHLMSYLNSDTSEEHLVHAATRLLFAVHCDLMKK